MTVEELLTGRKRPITNIEFNDWMAYFVRKAKMQEQANKKANR